MSIQFIYSLITGFIFGLSVYFSLKAVLDNDLKLDNHKYRPVFTGYIMPIALFAGFIANMVYGVQNSFMLFINYCINIILIITIYYLFVFLFLKVFRKYLHPLVVSTIWTLPNILYFFIMYRHELYLDHILILEVSPIVLFSILVIWFLVFVIIIGYKIYEHFSYRNMILEDAQEISDAHILSLFENEKAKIDFKIKHLALIKSKHIYTPLTIGVKNKVIVLPDKNYSDEEYQLIFKHEIIHIARCDVDAKVYFAFCNALCWFNPLMWIANKKCSEDIELSCDTSVLIHKDSNIRKQYAHLILKNASCEKGFTSCLSTSAKSLQYRLKNIVEPKVKRNGGLLIFILVFLIVSSWGNIGVAIKGFNGNEHIFDSKNVDLIKTYPLNDKLKNQNYSLENEEAIIEYISNLELSRLPNASIDKNESDQSLMLTFESNSKQIYVFLYDNYVVVEDEHNEKYYYVKDGIDLDYLNQAIMAYPSLKLHMLLGQADFGYKLWPTLTQVSIDNEIVYSNEIENNSRDYSIYYNPTEFKFEIYDKVISKIEVIEKTEDEIKTYLVSKEDMISIPNKDVTYTIQFSCEKNDVIYDVIFTFDLDGWEKIDLNNKNY